MTMTRFPSLCAAVAAIFALIAASACAPIKDQRGYVPQKERLAQITVGEQDKEQVFNILGSPSTMATFDEDTWYYISSKTQRLGFFAPKIVDRKIVAIKFDNNEVVSGIANYGLEDGRVVNFVDRTTPTRGKELTFLEQMFGNIGKLPAPGADEEGP